MILSGLSLALTATAHSENVMLQFSCGEMEGYSITAAEGVNRSGEAEFLRDRVPGGESIIRLLGSDPLGDITAEYQYKDGSGEWFDPRQTDGVVSLHSLDVDASILITVDYKQSNTIETLLLTEVNEFGARLLYTATRNNPYFASSKVMTATCDIR